MERKEELGYAPPDNPLLRTGDLRSSIEHRVTAVTPLGSAAAIVGSTSEVARYQELGTQNIPPRAFIGRAVAERGNAEAQSVAAGVFGPLFGQGRGAASVWHHLLHRQRQAPDHRRRATDPTWHYPVALTATPEGHSLHRKDSTGISKS